MMRWDDGDSRDRGSHGSPYYQGADHMEDGRNDDSGAGRTAPVTIGAAMELPASWMPFTNAKAAARTTTTTSTG
jgi:hypothetical protein